MLLGLIVDYEIHINPKTRLIVQIFLTIGLVLLNDLLISKTNLFFLDDFLKNFYFNIFFTSLCILIILNGLNFMDGVNNNVIGFCLLLLISIYIIEYKNASFENLHFYNLFLLSLVIFYLFNSFNKNYLGDSGIYILSIFISVLVISFINNSPYVSPILAVNFLWYPAFETLFSIIRKLFVKKNPFKPDTGHLHTLILKYFGLKRFEFKNTTTGICINLALIPNFYIAINYHNNSKILFFTSVVYLIIYVMFYFRLNSFLKKKIII